MRRLLLPLALLALAGGCRDLDLPPGCEDILVPRSDEPNCVSGDRCEQVQADAAESASPEMQPPQKCLLCGKGFLDPPELCAHCDAGHHSWTEAAKRILWEAEQLEDLSVLPPGKRRNIQNVTAALT